MKGDHIKIHPLPMQMCRGLNQHKELLVVKLLTHGCQVVRFTGKSGERQTSLIQNVFICFLNVTKTAFSSVFF